MPIRTQVRENEALTLNIIAIGVGTPTLKYRELGGGSWASITASNVGRSVYSATIPAQAQDFEYYVESGSVVFPVTATSASPIYQTVVVMTAETDPGQEGRQAQGQQRDVGDHKRGRGRPRKR
jgi:hypothetical protein